MKQQYDIAQLKASSRIEDIVPTRGITLVRSGSRLVGHCPMHQDSTPSFTVYPSTQSFFCYGCRTGGDVLNLIEWLDDCSFAEAVQTLQGTSSVSRTDRERPRVPTTVSHQRRQGRDDTQHHTQEETGEQRDHPSSSTLLLPSTQGHATPPVFTIATAIYQTTLLHRPEVMAYLSARGISVAMVKRAHLGYADGIALPTYLTLQPTYWHAAQREGLLTASGAEHLAHRLVIPEIVDEHSTWMIGRLVADQTETNGSERPKYLGIPGTKPLLGDGRAHATLRQRRNGELRGILIVEGALDYVIAVGWSLPVLCVALLGTHASRSQCQMVQALFELCGAPLLVSLDDDAAGRAGTSQLLAQLHAQGLPARSLAPLAPAKDIGDLALQPGGRTRLLSLLSETVRGEDHAG